MSKLRKVRREKGYTEIYNDVTNHKELDFKALGVYIYLFSKPDNWQFSIVRIAQAKDVGHDYVRSAIQTLETLGLLVRTKAKNKEGKFTGFDYDLYDKIDKNRGIQPSSENPMTVNPMQGKSRTNKEKNIETKEVKKKEVVSTHTTFNEPQDQSFSNPYQKPISVKGEGGELVDYILDQLYDPNGPVNYAVQYGFVGLPKEEARGFVVAFLLEKPTAKTSWVAEYLAKMLINKQRQEKSTTKPDYSKSEPYKEPSSRDVIIDLTDYSDAFPAPDPNWDKPQPLTAEDIEKFKTKLQKIRNS